MRKQVVRRLEIIGQEDDTYNGTYRSWNQFRSYS